MTIRMVIYLFIFMLTCITTECISQHAPSNASLNTDLIQAAMHDRAIEIKSLLAKGANPNTRGPNGFTPIMFVALQSDATPIHILQKAGGDIDARDENGQTALIHAVTLNRMSNVKLLLASGANVNITDNIGQTALMNAVNVSESIVRLLYDHGAKVNVQDRKGKTALFLVVDKSSTLPFPKPSNALLPFDNETAALRKRIDLLPIASGNRIKKDYGLPSNASTSDLIQKIRRIPSDHSASVRWQKFYLMRVRIVRMLLNMGADVNIKPTSGFTSLMAAAHYGNVEMLEDLLNKHPILNARDNKGRTALQIAKYGKKPKETVPLLIKAGVKE